MLNGTFEALFEYFSLDKLLTGNPKKLILALLQQGGVEASEEATTTLANNVADILVMAEKSDYQLKIQAYMESGMSREEATKQALLDKCIELGWDAAGGFFSGGISGGISTKVSGIDSSRGTQTQGQTRAQIQGQGMTAALQDQAPQLTAKTDSSAASPVVKPLNTGQQTEETEQYIAALRNPQESDTINERDRRIALALELAGQGKTPSQIYQETGLVTKANGDIMDGFGGEVIWRSNGQQRISDRETSESKTEGQTQTEISGDDGRGDAGGLLQQTGRSTYESLTEQQRVRARDTIIRRLQESGRQETLILLEEYSDNEELSYEIYNDYVAGNVALEQWAEFFGDIEGLSRELDEIFSPGGLQNDAHLEKGSPLGGAVERSETEGGTTAAEAAANTDPTEAARQQQYQTEIADALRAGEYQRALALFKEYGNPNLRALNDFQTLKAFGEFAAAMGYGVSPEDISTDQTLTAFEESYQNAIGGIENNGNNDIINEESIDEIDLQSDYGKLIDSQEKVDKYYARAIKSTFRGGTSLAKKVFLKYVKPDSVASTTAISSFFKDGKVHLCAAKDINRKTGKVKNYFHEHGHYIDFFAAGSTNEDRLSMLNVQFGRKLRSDYAAYLQKTMNEYGVSQEEAEEIIAEGLEDHKKDGVSDIIDGITDGKVYGYARHSFSDPNYWKSPGKVEREAFANMFQSCFEPKTIKYMAEYFPEAYKEFKKMLKGLI